MNKEQPGSRFEFRAENEVKEAELEKALAEIKDYAKRPGFEGNAAEIAANFKMTLPGRIPSTEIEALRPLLEAQREQTKQIGSASDRIQEDETFQQLYGLTRQELGLTDDDFNKALTEQKKWSDGHVGETDSLGDVERDLWYPQLIALKRLYPEKFKAEEINPELLETVRYDVQNITEHPDFFAPDFTVRRIAQCAELFPDKLDELGITPALAETLRKKIEYAPGAEAIEIAANLKRLEALLNG
jgi:hypothetical protein